MTFGSDKSASIAVVGSIGGIGAAAALLIGGGFISKKRFARPNSTEGMVELNGEPQSAGAV